MIQFIQDMFQKYMKMAIILCVSMVYIFTLTTCGSLFPHTASVEIRLNTNKILLNDGLSITNYTNFKFINVYISGEGYSSQEKDIEFDNIELFTLTWYGNSFGNFTITGNFQVNGVDNIDPEFDLIEISNVDDNDHIRINIDNIIYKSLDDNPLSFNYDISEY